MANSNPWFGMSVVAQMCKMHPQTIRHYERVGLVTPSRTSGRVRMFSPQDIRRLQQIQSLTDMGVNLAGVEIIVRLLQQVEDLRQQIQSR
jgi:MerR family transcriptional regulator/heat shock protein HspR